MPQRSWIVMSVLSAGLTLTGCAKEDPAADDAGAAAVTADVETRTVDLDALPQDDGNNEYDSLHDLMEDLADHYKFLRRNADSAEPDAMLEHTAEIRRLAVMARTMTPEQVEDAAAEERAALKQTYLDHLDKLGPALDTLEAAIRSGDRAAAQAAVDELHEVEEHGHEALGVEDDH